MIEFRTLGRPLEYFGLYFLRLIVGNIIGKCLIDSDRCQTRVRLGISLLGSSRKILYSNLLIDSLLLNRELRLLLEELVPTRLTEVSTTRRGLIFSEPCTVVTRN